MEQTPSTPVAAARRRQGDRDGEITGTETEDTKAQKFMQLHNDAYKMTSEAMKLDEESKRDLAFNAYQKALELIDKAVIIAHTGGFSETKVGKIDELTYKMRMSRKEILERVSDIQHTPSASNYLHGPGNVPMQPPQAAGSSGILPAYESLTPRNESTERNIYSSLNISLDEIAADEGALMNPLPLNAQEIFTVPENVQIFFIGGDDNVSAPSYPSFLRVVVINKDEPQQVSTQPPAFLQVGDWTYPLVPDQSPILHAADGSYIFPDTRPEAPAGSSVGLILPADLPAQQKQALEDVLLQLIGQNAFHTHIPTTLPKEESKVKPKPPRPPEPIVVPPTTTGAKIAAGLLSGAEKIAQGLVYGAEKTSQYMEKGASYLVTKIEPSQEKPTFSPQVHSGMKTARNVTGKAVKVSSYVVNQLSKGTMKLGHYIAPHVHRTATQLYAKTLNTNEAEASGKMGQIIEVTGSAVVGFGTVFMGLEHAAVVLAKSLRNNTVTVVQHKYGDEASSLCDDTVSTVGNSVVTGYNVKGLAPKAFVRRAAKDAGKAIITSPTKDNHNRPPPGSSDGSGPS